MKHVSSPPRTPVQLARSLYGAAFAGTDRRSIQLSMKDFEQLTPDDRLFIQCHLQYLTMCAQERTQQLLLALHTTLEHQTGAVYAIADEILRPALEPSAMEMEMPPGAAVESEAREAGPSELVGASPSAERWLSEIQSSGEWKPLPGADAMASSATSVLIPALPRAEPSERSLEGGEHAAE